MAGLTVDRLMAVLSGMLGAAGAFAGMEQQKADQAKAQRRAQQDYDDARLRAPVLAQLAALDKLNHQNEVTGAGYTAGNAPEKKVLFPSTSEDPDWLKDYIATGKVL